MSIHVINDSRLQWFDLWEKFTHTFQDIDAFWMDYPYAIHATRRRCNLQPFLQSVSFEGESMPQELCLLLRK